jgi:hypothetical protein
VILCDPRQHGRPHAQYIIENLVFAAFKWKLTMVNVYVMHGRGLGQWTEDIWEESLTCLQRSPEANRGNGERESTLRVLVHLIEIPYDNFHWFEYSYVLKTPSLWHYIAHHVCPHTSHVLFIQYDTSLSLNGDAPSLADFGTKYDYVGCPGYKGSWTADICNATNTPPDGMCSLIGGLSLRSLRYSLQGVMSPPNLSFAHPSLFFPLLSVFIFSSSFPLHFLSLFCATMTSLQAWR